MVDCKLCLTTNEILLILIEIPIPIPAPGKAVEPCKIPSIHPFDGKALKLIYAEVKERGLKPPPCLENPSRFKTDLNTSLLRLNLTSEFWNAVDCCYYPFTTVITRESYYTL
jgi:hypothetical protein